LKNENDINIFGRKIAQEDDTKQTHSSRKHEDDHRFSHILLGDFPTKNIDVIFILFSILFLTATEDHSLISIIVEVTSAFGTTGLSFRPKILMSFSFFKNEYKYRPMIAIVVVRIPPPTELGEQPMNINNEKIISTVAIWLLEKDHNFAHMNLFDQWLNSSFYSMTTRR
jgi:hypothetical protein